MRSLSAPLLVITNRELARCPLPAVLRQVLEAGCRWILVREKDLPPPALHRLVQELMAVAQPYGAAVSVSGNAEVAAACGAYGVHVPRNGSVSMVRTLVGRQALVGASAHSLAEAWEAARAGADYVTLSPVFLSPSKPGYGPALGLAQLRCVAKSLPIPVLALGGMTPSNAAACLRAGAAGLAMMGAVMRAPDPGAVVSTILQSIAVSRERNETADEQS